MMVTLVVVLTIVVGGFTGLLPQYAGHTPEIVQAQNDERCFPETGYCISGNIRAYWENYGGLPVFGYPIGPQQVETIEMSWTGNVQWFERDRLEDHGDEGVMAGRLGDDILQLNGQSWQDFPKVTAAGEGCRFFAQTGHSLCEPFLGYWLSHGGLERFGYPITEPFEETISDWSGTIQYFERRRMEHHTEFAGTPHEVLLGLLGKEVKEFVGGTGTIRPTPRPTTTATPVPTSTPQSAYPAPSEEDEGEQDIPTTEPTDAPTDTPPTDTPPTSEPTNEPTDTLPTNEPTDAPPTSEPTDAPTPSATPTDIPPTTEPTATPAPSATPTTAAATDMTPGACITAEEAKLAQLINEYRQSRGLSAVPISKSLSEVAQLHVRDLQNNRPHEATDSRGMECNMHSWSNQGDWSPVCYTSDHEYAAGMWDKPREITDGAYTGNGYENSYGHSNQADATGAIESWKNSSGHNAVIIEEGIWEGKNWQAMGVGIYEGFAVLWFGEESDPQGTLNVCGE
jgi:uncharacterized protein YkwD